MKYFAALMALIFSVHTYSNDALNIESIDVHDLDASISSKPLGQWLHSVLEENWVVAAGKELTGCGEISGDPEQQDYPLCIEIKLTNNEQIDYLYISVGTSKSGVSGGPKFYWGVVGGKGINKLSSLVGANAL